MKCLTSNLRYFCIHRIAIAGPRLKHLEAMSTLLSCRAALSLQDFLFLTDSLKHAVEFLTKVEEQIGKPAGSRCQYKGKQKKKEGKHEDWGVLLFFGETSTCVQILSKSLEGLYNKRFTFSLHVTNTSRFFAKSTSIHLVTRFKEHNELFKSVTKIKIAVKILCYVPELLQIL